MHIAIVDVDVLGRSRVRLTPGARSGTGTSGRRRVLEITDCIRTIPGGRDLVSSRTLGILVAGLGIRSVEPTPIATSSWRSAARRT
jgi:hypothetical protein